MAFDRRVYVVLPAFNEEAALRALIPEIVQSLRSESALFTICVVDDGSIDGTAALLQEFVPTIPLQLLKHAKNQGYGAALRTGIAWVIEHGLADEALVTLDADRTHSPEFIPAMLEKLKAGYDVVTASYWISGAKAQGVPWLRGMMSRAVNLLLRMRFRVPGVQTYSNGFRAYRVGVLQAASKRFNPLIAETDFAGGTELFLKVTHAGARAAEVPFTLYYDRRGTGSKIRFLPTILGYLKLLQ